MNKPKCSVCGLPADASGDICPHCGNKLAVDPKTQQSRDTEPEGESDFSKYLAVGVFTGALVAAALVLFLVFSSGGTQKTGDVAPAQDTLIQSPAHTVPPATVASPTDEPSDDRKPAAVPVRRGLKKSPPAGSEDGKRKRQDIIETPGKNPKMTQY